MAEQQREDCRKLLTRYCFTNVIFFEILLEVQVFLLSLPIKEHREHLMGRIGVCS